MALLQACLHTLNASTAIRVMESHGDIEGAAQIRAEMAKEAHVALYNEEGWVETPLGSTNVCKVCGGVIYRA